MIEIHLDGKPVTPMEAARALNVTGGPHALVRTEREDGPQAKVYAAFCGSRGVLRPPWLSCPAFTADSADGARAAAHVISTAADLITLAELLAAEQVTEFTTSSQGASSAPCTQPEQHHPNLSGAAVDCDVAGHHGPARISEAAVDKAMAVTLGWCPAATGPDEELERELYCDKQLGEDGCHAGNHHAKVGDGSEVMWGDEADPLIRKGSLVAPVAAGPASVAPEPVRWQCTYCWTEFEAMPSEQPPACPECGPLHGPGASAAQPRIKPEAEAAMAPLSLVGMIVEDAHDDSPVPVTGRVVAQADEEHVMVAWGDRQHDEDPGRGTREPVDALRPVPSTAERARAGAAKSGFKPVAGA